MEKPVGNAKLAVILPNFIGDVLMATPALSLLKTCYPGCEIYAVTTIQGRELLSGNPDIKRVFLRSLRPSVLERHRLMVKLRRLEPEMVFLFRPTVYNAAIAFVSGAKVRAGTRGELVSLLLTHARERLPERSFRKEYVQTVRQVFPGNDLSRDQYRTCLSVQDVSLHFELPERYAVLMPGSSRFSKMWPSAGYARTAEHLARKHRLPVVLVGATSDLPAAHAIMKQSGEPLIDLVNKTDLKQLATVLRRAKLFIGPDTGALYMAEALGVPAISLWGSTNPESCGPFPGNATLLYKSFPCSPCEKNYCPKVKKTCFSPCMEAISTQEVCDAIDRIF